MNIHKFLFLFFLTLGGCVDKQKPQNVSLSSLPSDTELYQFMRNVIDTQHLNLDCALQLELENGCDLSMNDSLFLEQLLLEKNSAINFDSAGFNLSFEPFGLPKCLTQEDINEMLLQKAGMQNFKWDNKKLGFNQSNNKCWYSFSQPLFNIKKNIAIMLVRDLCPGLCGGGRTVMFTKENNKWISHEGGFWIH